MHASLRSCLPLALLVLAGCSPKDAPQPAPQAEAPKPAVPKSAVAEVVPEQETCTNQPRTDENDTRPRCAGMAVAAPPQAYRITLDNGESFTACDITKPFSGKIGGGMVTMSFTPGDDKKSGKVAWHFAGSGGVADTAYDYALEGPEDKMTGTCRANAAVCGKAAGLGVCASAKKQAFTSTWTHIDDCEVAK